jgi:hypothetical protein
MKEASCMSTDGKTKTQYRITSEPGLYSTMEAGESHFTPVMSPFRKEEAVK